MNALNSVTCACCYWARTDGQLTDHHPNCQAPRRFVKVTLVGHGTYMQPESALNVLLDEIKDAEPGAKWTLELVMLTPAEFDRLPEFAGH